MWYRPHRGGTHRTDDDPDRADPDEPRCADARSPEPLVVPPGTIAPGRARGAGPLRREGPAKLTGEAKYADDLVFPGAWYGVTIRSTDAHARFVGLDLDEGFDWSKVVVVTAADIPGENVVSLISDDQPILVPIGGEIQHHSEPLALLAAADRETLRGARRHVKVRADALPPVFDPRLSDHVFAHYDIAQGDLDKGFAAADHILEGTYRVGHQEQLYIENNAMIAVPREDGGVAVHGSLQCPYYIHKAMKRAFGFNDAQAQVVQAETGGGFGGKEEYPSIIALHAALLARKSGKPVRMIYDRHEDLSATTKRHPAIVTHRTGVKVDGTITAQEIEIVMDGGAYCTLTPVVLSRGAIHAGGPYRCENVRIRARATRTNTPPNGAFRGFGAPQVEFAAEIQVDRLAEALGMSPIEIRRRNLYREGDTTPTGQVLRESVAASGGARASGGGGRVRGRPGADGARPGPPHRLRVAAGGAAPDLARPGRVGDRDRARLARRRVHRLGRGQARVGRVGRAGRRRRRAGPHRVNGDGPGHEDDLPAARRRRAGHRLRGRRDRAAGHRDRARFRPDGREPDGDGRRRAADPGRAAAPRRGRGAQRRPAVRRGLPLGLRAPRPHSRRPAVRALPGRRLRRRDVPRRRLPGVRLGGVRRDRSTSTSTAARSRSATSSRPTTSAT